MSYENSGTKLIEYAYCDYGTTQAVYRGPEAEIGGRTVSFIGSGETFGRFVLKPFVQTVGDRINRPTANFGQINAGLDVFVQSADIISLCQRSAITVIQVMGAQNMSNRLYSVHPRRNDRFIRPSALMQTIFKEIEFNDFNFNLHMLNTIKSQAPDRFPIVEQELKAAWTARMRMLLSQIGGKIILLWIPCRTGPNNTLGTGPLFIDQTMMEEMRSMVDLVLRPEIPDEISNPIIDGLIYSPFDQAAAALALTPKQHDQIAKCVAEAIVRL